MIVKKCICEGGNKTNYWYRILATAWSAEPSVDFHASVQSPLWLNASVQSPLWLYASVQSPLWLYASVI